MSTVNSHIERNDSKQYFVSRLVSKQAECDILLAEALYKFSYLLCSSDLTMCEFVNYNKSTWFCMQMIRRVVTIGCFSEQIVIIILQ